MRNKGKNNSAPGQSLTGKKADSSNVNFDKHNKSNPFQLFTYKYSLLTFIFLSLQTAPLRRTWKEVEKRP